MLLQRRYRLLLPLQTAGRHPPDFAIDVVDQEGLARVDVLQRIILLEWVEFDHVARAMVLMLVHHLSLFVLLFRPFTFGI